MPDHRICWHCPSGREGRVRCETMIFDDVERDVSVPYSGGVLYTVQSGSHCSVSPCQMIPLSSARVTRATSLAGRLC